ncbi:MAG: iron dicitrate transport regulator FecR [Verrucomicrobiota bacterium]
MNDQNRLQLLIESHLLGRISDQDLADLEHELTTSSEARQLYRRAARIDSLMETGIQKADLSSESHETPERTLLPSRSLRLREALLIAAVLTLSALILVPQLTKARSIATLVSAEDAAWESALPTTPGAELGQGEMRLLSGLATIRFRSGAEMTLEAPVVLELVSPMHASLASGAAVFDVPESAIGFELETPDGLVVDHGTSFAVHVGEGRPSTFEVIEGAISVQNVETGEEVWLADEQSAIIENANLTTFDGPLPTPETANADAVTTLGTGGRSWSVIRANREKWMRPELLAVKRKRGGSNHERRSFFSFDLEGVDLSEVVEARIRLNQVPSGVGYASTLPKVSEVAIYGLTNSEMADWEVGATWEEGPTPEDGVKLGSIEIPRSQQRASRVFSNQQLLDYLRVCPGKEATFILDREFDPDRGTVPSLLIAFASDRHPEAAGPVLELVYEK